MPGEMAGEKRLVHRDGFHADATGVAFESRDSIDHQERITVRKKFHHLTDIEPAFARRKRVRFKDGSRARELTSERADQLGVRAVTRLNRDDVTVNSLPEKREVPDDIEDFVTDEFVGEPKRFLAQHRVAANHDRVFETAALDEVLVHQVTDVLVKNERPCRRDLVLVNRGRNFGGKELGKLSVRSRLRARDPEFWIGQNDEERTGLRFDM